MSVFHVFKVVQMVPNRATYHICILRISFNATLTAFETRFTKHLAAEIVRLYLVGFLCNLGVRYVLGSFLFISMTSRLNLLFRNHVFSASFTDFVYRL